MTKAPTRRLISTKVENPQVLDALKDMAKGFDGILANSVNRTTTWAKREAARDMRKITAFPARYLSGNKLVTSRARFSHPTASITARFKPTLLSTFAKNAPAILSRRQKPAVEVKPGGLSYMGRAFWIRLPNGVPAIAMKADDYKHYYGELTSKPFGARKGKGGIVVLYSPSIDQSFWIEAGNIQGDVSDKLAEEVLNELRRKGF